MCFHPQFLSPRGDGSGEAAGDPLGDAAGDPLGDAAGDPLGDAAGDPAGDFLSAAFFVIAFFVYCACPFFAFLPPSCPFFSPRGECNGVGQGDAAGDATGEIALHTDPFERESHTRFPGLAIFVFPVFTPTVFLFQNPCHSCSLELVGELCLVFSELHFAFAFVLYPELVFRDFFVSARRRWAIVLFILEVIF